MIHWTHQVKVVSHQHEGGLGRASPLDELAFWRARLADLGGIRDQLRSSGQSLNIICMMHDLLLSIIELHCLVSCAVLFLGRISNPAAVLSMSCYAASEIEPAYTVDLTLAI